MRLPKPPPLLSWCVGDYCALDDAASSPKAGGKARKKKGSLGESFAVIRSSPKVSCRGSCTVPSRRRRQAGLACFACARCGGAREAQPIAACSAVAVPPGCVLLHASSPCATVTAWPPLPAPNCPRHIRRNKMQIMNLALLVVSYGVSHRLFEFAWKGQLRALYPTAAAYQVRKGRRGGADGLGRNVACTARVAGPSYVHHNNPFASRASAGRCRCRCRCRCRGCALHVRTQHTLAFLPSALQHPAPHSLCSPTCPSPPAGAPSPSCCSAATSSNVRTRVVCRGGVGCVPSAGLGGSRAVMPAPCRPVSGAPLSLPYPDGGAL